VLLPKPPKETFSVSPDNRIGDPPHVVFPKTFLPQAHTVTAFIFLGDTSVFFWS